jgi:hypothetical protein
MRAIVVTGLVLAMACGGSSRDQGAASRPRTPGVRITMDRLHQLGGVPPGWRLTPPAGDVAAGRQTFVDFGCPSCHRVQGEPFSDKSNGQLVGPELTGMGSHHPPAYFAEAILNPDAVLVEGPGYIGPEGHSVMPDYPEMTLRQLGDLVAYLSSLTSGDPHAGMIMAQPGQALVPANVSARPAPAPGPGRAFFLQSYDVKPGQLEPFEAWWRAEGAKRFLAIDGLLGVDTWVDFTRPERPYTTILAFRDAAALQTFSANADAQRLGLEFDGFVGDHSHAVQLWSPIYRVPSLSAP